MVDLFAGAGGLSLGLEAAGFRAALAVECDPDSCQTYASAFPETCLLSTRIESLDFSALANGVELVAGGPPCQPFSSGGRRLGSADDRDMLPEFLRAVSEIRPPAFIMENVPGLASGQRHGYFGRFLHGARALGYVVSWRILTAAEHGVPQKRQRLFVVGSLLGQFTFPRPTTSADSPELRARRYLDPCRIVGEPNLSKVTYAKNPDLRPDPYDGHVFNGGGRPIDLDGLCPTILATAGGNKTPFLDAAEEVPRYHQELLEGHRPRSGALPGARRITAEEAAIVQTFPQGYPFSGARSSRYRQVGNAVPPLLAQRIGAALLAHLNGAAAMRTAHAQAADAHSG